jgi:hypothetical protein
MILLSVVFLTDLLVFKDLCRDELRDQRARRGAGRIGGAGGEAMAARSS